jgi:hypothetical protein
VQNVANFIASEQDQQKQMISIIEQAMYTTFKLFCSLSLLHCSLLSPSHFLNKRHILTQSTLSTSTTTTTTTFTTNIEDSEASSTPSLFFFFFFVIITKILVIVENDQVDKKHMATNSQSCSMCKSVLNDESNLLTTFCEHSMW